MASNVNGTPLRGLPITLATIALRLIVGKAGETTMNK